MHGVTSVGGEDGGDIRINPCERVRRLRPPAESFTRPSCESGLRYCSAHSIRYVVCLSRLRSTKSRSITDRLSVSEMQRFTDFVTYSVCRECAFSYGIVRCPKFQDRVTDYDSLDVVAFCPDVCRGDVPNVGQLSGWTRAIRPVFELPVIRPSFRSLLRH